MSGRFDCSSFGRLVSQQCCEGSEEPGKSLHIHDRGAGAAKALVLWMYQDSAEHGRLLWDKGKYYHFRGTFSWLGPAPHQTARVFPSLVVWFKIQWSKFPVWFSFGLFLISPGSEKWADFSPYGFWGGKCGAAEDFSWPANNAVHCKC